MDASTTMRPDPGSRHRTHGRFRGVRSEDDPPRGSWRSYVGPVVLSDRRRRLNLLLLVAWTAAAVTAAVTGHYELLWLPILGMMTSSVLALRGRAGRRQVMR